MQGKGYFFLKNSIFEVEIRSSNPCPEERREKMNRGSQLRADRDVASFILCLKQLGVVCYLLAPMICCNGVRAMQILSSFRGIQNGKTFDEAPIVL